MTEKEIEIRSKLARHFATEAYHHCGYSMDGPLITDGVLDMVQMCGAFWLIDLIAQRQRDKNIARELFQVWQLALDQDDLSATLVCSDGDGRELCKTSISYTDFPLSEGITLWKEDDIILLPSEH